MTEKLITYVDLSKKQIQHLKEIYVQKKVNGMSHADLKSFVSEIISHQIHETIGHEEELEAWNEMSDYFGEQFEVIIAEIQKKFSEIDNVTAVEENSKKERVELLERNNFDNEKKDMWDD